MEQSLPNRIHSLDLLKGIIIILMALDHTRDYFHDAILIYDALDPNKTNIPVYLSRWITHFCAPGFSLLAGISAYLIGQRKTKNELATFLLKRGIWLIIIEMTIITFGWYFDIRFKVIALLVIWALGISMIALAALIYLPRNWILIFSCILIFGHNFLDGVHFEKNFIWTALHEVGYFKLSENHYLRVGYPVIPWIGVMSLGYYFGVFYSKRFTPNKRRKTLNIIGLSSVLLFVVLRCVNYYGNAIHWKEHDTFAKTMFSFFNTEKYPPSLTFLLMTLGPMFLFLANSENLKGKITRFFSTFGKVPFFFYIIHIYVIHLFALLFAEISGYGWRQMLMTFTGDTNLDGYGVSIWIVSIIWIAIVLLLYPLCKKFGFYKQNHKEKWWLSYL
ncbi:DUF1624 domain-containing protein [Leptobacterium sp. I13]|uniref:DUF1624 domain-containing protein n=1 Tax=Leptobacterium meishanense TaxID=3128904 RepID=UPI0030ED59C0